MTTLQMAQRLAADLGEDDYSLLAMDIRVQILDAMNAGIQRYHAKTTSKHRTLPVSCLISAPKDISLNVTENEATFTGYTIEDNDFYCTVHIDGDPIPNQLTGDGQLFDHYTGATGTVSGRIYYDAIPLYIPIRRMVSAPILTGSCRGGLARHDRAEWLKGVSRPHGAPTAYSLDYNAFADNGEVPVIVRLNSLPDKSYKLRFEVEVDALHLGHEHLQKPISIPVRPSHVESYLMPMVRAALTSSAKWKNKENISLVNDQADTAEVELSNETFVHTASSHNRIGTAPGF